MSLSAIQLKVKNALQNLGWCNTLVETVITKNSCYLSLNGNSYEALPKKSFYYSKDDISSIILHDYDMHVMNLDGACITQPLVEVNGVDYYMEKYGWLLVKGKYDKDYNYESSDAKFKSFIDYLNELSMRDHVMLKGVKQHLVTLTKAETVLKGIPAQVPITEGCNIEVIKDSRSDSLFKAGALFQVVIITDEFVFLTAYNKKGALSNKNYQVPASVFLQEAVNKNFRTVTISPFTEEVQYTTWVNYNSSDLKELPKEIRDMTFNDAQTEVVSRAYGNCYNITALLNCNATEESYETLYNICATGYCNMRLFNMRLRESSAKIFSRYIHLGLDPARFLDDTMDSMELETELQSEYNNAEAYKQQLKQQDLNTKLVDMLFKYRFRTGEKFNIKIDDSTRWQYLLPYVVADFMDEEEQQELSNIIKSYGILYDEGCVLKTLYLNAELKGVIIRYFRSPIDFEFNEESWNEFLMKTLNSSSLLQLDTTGFAIKGNTYVIGRDINSLYISDLANVPIWRCVFINEKAISYGDCSTIVY